MTREQAIEHGKEQLEIFGGEHREFIEMAIKVLEQEPRKGHWMKSNIGGAKVCSVCNAHMGLSSFKYCPNCGAKMADAQKSEVRNELVK